MIFCCCRKSKFYLLKIEIYDVYSHWTLPAIDEEWVYTTENIYTPYGEIVLYNDLDRDLSTTYQTTVYTYATNGNPEYFTFQNYRTVVVTIEAIEGVDDTYFYQGSDYVDVGHYIDHPILGKYVPQSFYYNDYLKVMGNSNSYMDHTHALNNAAVPIFYTEPSDDTLRDFYMNFLISVGGVIFRRVTGAFRIDWGSGQFSTHEEIRAAINSKKHTFLILYRFSAVNAYVSLTYCDYDVSRLDSYVDRYRLFFYTKSSLNTAYVQELESVPQPLVDTSTNEDFKSYCRGWLLYKGIAPEKLLG